MLNFQNSSRHMLLFSPGFEGALKGLNMNSRITAHFQLEVWWSATYVTQLY